MNEFPAFAEVNGTCATCQNNIKQNSEDLMNDLMTIKIEGPVIEEFKVAPAIGLWKSKRGEFCAVFCSVETLYVDFQALNFIVQRDM